jgi:hypothetical protein
MFVNVFGRSYWQFLCQHALCNVHHLRDLTFLFEHQLQAWAGEMISLLLDIKAAVEQACAEGRASLHPLEVADWKAQYVALLEAGYQANPPDPPPKIGTKGRRKQSTARNLLDRLSKHQEAVLLFLDNFAVPFDNDVIAYCTPSAWLACFVKRVWRLFVGWRKQRNPTAIGLIHGNATSSPPIPDRLWTHAIGLCGFTGG